MSVLKVLTGLIAGLGATTANAGGPVIIEEGAGDQLVDPARKGVKPVFILLGVVAAVLLASNGSDEEAPPPCTGEC
jgi:hypothetical protein